MIETREDGALPSSLVPDDPDWGKPSSAATDFAAAIDRSAALVGGARPGAGDEDP